MLRSLEGGVSAGGRGRREDLRAELRSGFSALGAVDGAAPLSARKAALAEGSARLSSLRRQTGVRATTAAAAAAAEGAPAFFPDVAPAPLAGGALPRADPPDDERYRKGSGWPWERAQR